MTPQNGPCPNLDAGLVRTDLFSVLPSHLHGVQCQETPSSAHKPRGIIPAIRTPLYRVEEVPPLCVPRSTTSLI